VRDILLILQFDQLWNIMKTNLLAVTFTTLLLAGSVVSCDFMRTLAGRPTSARLEEMKIEQKKAEESRRLEQDRIRIEKKNEEALNTLAGLGVVLKPASIIKSGIIDDLPLKYYVMIGAFSKVSNATRQADRATSAGYAVTVVSYGNGNKAVGIDAGNTPAELLDMFLKVSKEDFCPLEPWVLVKD